ncbi:MAG TPA: hypothetical protein VF626_05225 [Chthoniobacterales bacterium]|jgi:hypothetical protein
MLYDLSWGIEQGWELKQVNTIFGEGHSNAAAGFCARLNLLVAHGPASITTASAQG